ncbi:MAG: ribosome maturation factor RimP [bacterium]|nr:ribosome maturation factor RimP [bacterium]
MDVIGRIESLISPSLQEMGLSLVRAQLSGKERMKLQIMIERDDETPVKVGDCQKASRAISTLMDVEDPISGAYTLEVSSPGLDRPLVQLKDFERFAGNSIKLATHAPIEDRKRFSGLLQGRKGETVILEVDLSDGESVELHVDFSNIRQANINSSHT